MEVKSIKSKHTVPATLQTLQGALIFLKGFVCSKFNLRYFQLEHGTKRFTILMLGAYCMASITSQGLLTSSVLLESFPSAKDLWGIHPWTT